MTKVAEINKTFKDVGNWRSKEWQAEVIATRGKKDKKKMNSPPECSQTIGVG